MKDESQSTGHPVIRIVTATGCVVILALALRVVLIAWHARNTHTLMSNWKNGWMSYQEGFEIAGILILIAGAWGYCAFKTKNATVSDNRKNDSKKA